MAHYLDHAKSRIKLFDTAGKLVRELSLPGIGSASGFGGTPDSSETFFAFESFTQPESIFRLDVKTGETTPFKAPRLGFDPTRYETKQVFFTSKDGTRVPMFVSYQRDLAAQGPLPTYLYGYGGFNISMTPYFRIAYLVWMELGGAFAVPNLRGANEYGDEWHSNLQVANQDITFNFESVFGGIVNFNSNVVINQGIHLDQEVLFNGNGVVNVNAKIGIKNAKVGQTMTLHVHHHSVVADLTPANGTAPTHRFITGPLEFSTPDRTGVKLWTPDGEQTFPSDRGKTALAGTREGCPITVELNGEGTVVDFHRLN